MCWLMVEGGNGTAACVIVSRIGNWSRVRALFCILFRKNLRNSPTATPTCERRMIILRTTWADLERDLVDRKPGHARSNYSTLSHTRYVCAPPG